MRLAVVGASVRAATASALRGGFDAVGADLFADADLDGVCPVHRVADYPDGLAEWLAAQRVDAWMYTGGLENHPELIDRMAGTTRLWGVAGDTLRRVRDPFVLQGFLHSAGLPFPETRASVEGLPVDGSWLAKTYRHAAGAGVRRLAGAADVAWARDRGTAAQRCLAGESVALVFAVGAGEAALLGVTRQLLRAADGSPDAWSYSGSIGPLAPDAALSDAIERLRQAFLAFLAFDGLAGIVGIDGVLAAEGLTPVEINPRYTASVEVLERSAGRSAVATHAACFAGGPLHDWQHPAGRVFGKRVVFARRAATVREPFSGWARDSGVADRPRTGERIEPGAPVCTVFAGGPDASVVDAALRVAEEECLRRLADGSDP